MGLFKKSKGFNLSGVTTGVDKVLKIVVIVSAFLDALRLLNDRLKQLEGDKTTEMAETKVVEPETEIKEE